MNIFNLLTKKKSIVGVEISDNAIRISYFRPKKGAKKGEEKKELFLVEEPIANNIISEGIILDKKLFAKALKDVWAKAKLKSSYAIISIPEDKIYSHIFPFPKTETEIQLKEAIKLAIDFELPIKKETSYIGSENAGDSNVINEILISGLQKNIADEYVDTLNSVGIKILALESHILSIARSIKSNFGQTVLITKINPKGTTIFILKDRSLRFSRTIEKTFLKEDSFLINEVNRIRTWFESEKKVSLSELALTEANIKDDYQKYLEKNGITKESESKWLVSLGATMRGEIIEGKDDQISLLPVGTAEAYSYQKITIFITIMRNITIGISLFFLFTFLATYFLFLSLSKKSNQAKPNSSTSVMFPDIPQKELWVKNLNSIVSASTEILSTTINWSILLDEINSRVINGITITNFSIISINDKINITGISKDRDTLNQFKKSLQDSSYLTGIELPITNIGQKGDIPFSVSFSLKDPNMLYNK